MRDGAVHTGIRAKLALENPFDTYVHDPARVDKQGWNSRHGFFETVIAAAQPKLVIELGVWKGMSAIHMAGLMQAQGIDGEVLAIDTFLGSSAHLSTPGRRAELLPKDGYPTLYQTFLANVHDAGMQDRIVPLPMDGNSAAYALARLGVKADLIHIDASHEYESCLADLRNYWPLLADDGILLADDYGTWPGVTRAVCQFCAEVDRPLFGTMAKAIVPKGPNQGFVMRAVKEKSYRRGAA
tara:strand:+ start:92513 stop:93232 length:720 start_codon:yes stop_codon:yes gene_type:complete